MRRYQSFFRHVRIWKSRRGSKYVYVAGFGISHEVSEIRFRSASRLIRPRDSLRFRSVVHRGYGRSRPRGFMVPAFRSDFFESLLTSDFFRTHGIPQGNRNTHGHARRRPFGRILRMTGGKMNGHRIRRNPSPNLRRLNRVGATWASSGNGRRFPGHFFGKRDAGAPTFEPGRTE